jgi:hypothetical protein
MNRPRSLKGYDFSWGWFYWLGVWSDLHTADGDTDVLHWDEML